MNSTHSASTVQRRRGAKRLSERDALAAALEREKQREADAALLERPKRGPFLEIEGLTEGFRTRLARAHRDIAREAKDVYRFALEQWADLNDEENPEFDPERVATYAEIMRSSVARAKWHDERAEGQIERFDRVRNCGTRIVHAQCQFCREEMRPIPEGCGVRRVCDRCDTQGAIQRRARFGRSRGRLFIDGVRHGLTRRKRAGGAYTEKMLTLTTPHFMLADCRRAKGRYVGVLDVARNEIEARIAAVFLAWPRFLRKVNRHWGARWEQWVAYHRAFEWTQAHDLLGHPHFHVFLWSPWIDVALLRAWWAEALRDVGVPVKQRQDGTPVISVDLRQLKSFNVHAVRELLKGGRRQALTLSRIDYVDDARAVRRGAGDDAFKYSEGWTIGDIVEMCSPETVARVYVALEGKRLTQASRGFYAEDPPPECPCCGSSQFRIWFVNPSVNGVAGGAAANDAACTHRDRGPP